MSTLGRATRRALLVLYPAAFGIAYVLLSFAHFPTPAGDLVRPVAAVVAGSVLIVLVLRLVLRTWPRASIACSVLLVGLSAPFLFVTVVATGVVWVTVQVMRGRLASDAWRHIEAVTLSRALAVFGSALLVVSAVIAAPVVVGSIYLHDSKPHTEQGANLPNVYLILLDGYPRTDTLSTIYGFDNSGFEREIAGLGFRASDGSRSNYPHTWLTLTSMLNGEYLDQVTGLNPAPTSPEEQYRRLMATLNEAAMPALLRDQGYEIVAIPSPFRSVAMQTADRYLDSGQLSAFEDSLLMHSQLAGPITRLVPDFLMAQQRDRFHSTLDSIIHAGEDSGDRPFFLFAHLLSPPHAPLVYGPSGEHLPLPSCVPESCALWEFPADAWPGLPGQISYVNGELVAMLRQLIDKDPNATIILMSDHGSRRDRADLDEFFHNFFAARTGDALQFPDDISPVNVLRLVVSSGPGPELPVLPYSAWAFADELRPLELTPFAPSP